MLQLTNSVLQVMNERATGDERRATAYEQARTIDSRG